MYMAIHKIEITYGFSNPEDRNGRLENYKKKKFHPRRVWCNRAETSAFLRW